MNSQLPDSPAAIVVQLLIDLSLTTDPDLGENWPVRATGETDSPDNVVTVYDTQGQQRGRSQTDGYRFEGHGFQVRVRSSLPTDGWMKAHEIAAALDQDVANRTVTLPNGNVYSVVSVSRTGDVLSLGRAAPNSKRSLFTVNGICPIVFLSGSAPVASAGYFPDGYFN